MAAGSRSPPLIRDRQRAHMEAAVKYSKGRHQFDQPIASFQGISFKLADMATEILAAELFTLQAARAEEQRSAL